MNTPTRVKGLRRYALIFAMTRRHAMTAREIAERVGGNEGTVRELLHAMTRLGLLREAEWEKREQGSPQRIPGYRSSPGQRQPDPATGKLLDVVTRRNSQVTADLTAFAALIARMRQSPASTYELVDACGLSYLTVRSLLNYGKTVQAFREAGWEQREGAPGGNKIALWACDGRAPVKRPAPMPKAEIWRRYEARRVRLRCLPTGIHRASSVFAWGAGA